MAVRGGAPQAVGSLLIRTAAARGTRRQARQLSGAEFEFELGRWVDRGCAAEAVCRAAGPAVGPRRQLESPEREVGVA